MRVSAAMRAALRGYALQFYPHNGNATIGSKILVDMINDFSDIRHRLRALADEARQAGAVELAEHIKQLAEEIDS